MTTIRQWNHIFPAFYKFLEKKFRKMIVSFEKEQKLEKLKIKIVIFINFNYLYLWIDHIKLWEETLYYEVHIKYLKYSFSLLNIFTKIFAWHLN